MYLFRVGDKVEITNPEDCCNGYAPEMGALKGKIATVIDVDNNSSVRLNIDGGRFKWCYKSIKVISRKTFKIGSRVKIISSDSACVLVAPDMEEYINKTAKIIDICRKSVRLDIDNRMWYWGIDMLELLSTAVLDNE